MNVIAHWDNTTICFGEDCPNCERERIEAMTNKPTPATDEEITLAIQQSQLDAFIARIERDREEIAQLRAEVEELRSAYVLQAAIMESVMRAIRGEPVSDFEASHGPVYEAMMLREANSAHARTTLALRADVERLTEIVQELEDPHQAALDRARKESEETHVKPDPPFSVSDPVAVGRRIVEEAFAHARSELRKKHAIERGNCYGELCICAEPRGMNRKPDYDRANTASRELNQAADEIRARKESEGKS